MLFSEILLARCSWVALAYFFREAHHNNHMSTTTQSLQPSANTAQSPPSRRKRKDSRRTTVTLSPEAVAIVDRLKAATGFSTSAAVEELIFRSEPQKSWLVEEDGFLVIHAPVREGRLTDDDVRNMLEECPF